MSRSSRVPTLWLLATVSVASCDPIFRVEAVAPLARPIADRCLDSAFRDIAFPPQHNAPARRDTALVAGLPYSPLTQRVSRDSTAALVVFVYRMGAFGQTEADTIGRTLGQTLLRVRDACGGTLAPGAAPYTVHRKLGH